MACVLFTSVKLQQGTGESNLGKIGLGSWSWRVKSWLLSSREQRVRASGYHVVGRWAGENLSLNSWPGKRRGDEEELLRTYLHIYRPASSKLHPTCLEFQLPSKIILPVRDSSFHIGNCGDISHLSHQQSHLWPYISISLHSWSQSLQATERKSLYMLEDTSPGVTSTGLSDRSGDHTGLGTWGGKMYDLHISPLHSKHAWEDTQNSAAFSNSLAVWNDAQNVYGTIVKYNDVVETWPLETGSDQTQLLNHHTFIRSRVLSPCFSAWGFSIKLCSYSLIFWCKRNIM